MGRAIRQAVSCGKRSFYPADPDELHRQVVSLLTTDGINSSADSSCENPPLVVVSPHAGYVFSGKTAGKAYGTLPKNYYERVIVLGPSHYEAFPGASIYDGDAFETPLGEIPIDTAFVAELRQRAELFHYVPAAESREHSIEVQLPFLQEQLGSFQLVPILTYDRSWESCKHIADSLLYTMTNGGTKTLVVASSDLFHGPGADKALVKSEEAVRGILKFDPGEFCEEIDAGRYMACGAGPIATAMLLAQGLGTQPPDLVDLTTSFAVHPVNDDYVVGYASLTFREGGVKCL